jgi:DNA-binding PadR family transcriptional regulator
MIMVAVISPIRRRAAPRHRNPAFAAFDATLFTMCIVVPVSTPHVILGLLSAGARHGYELKKAHDERFPEARPLAFGQVYATLERLAKKGHVEAAEVERVDGPDRTRYRLTPDGREELSAWLSQVEPPAPFVANPLATKATIALLAADRDTATAYLRRQRDAHLDRMREFTRMKTDPAASIAQVLAADHAIAHLDADLRWLETALDRVVALEEELS